MKIWFLVTNINENDLKMYEFPAEILEKEKELFSGIETVLLDKAAINIETGEELTVTYKGKKKELPDAFWPIFSNTDSFSIENALMSAGVRSLVDFNDYVVARSKAATYQRLAANGFKVPKTVMFFNEADKSVITDRFDYPFIIKTDNGFGGKGVELIENEQQLDDYLADLKKGVTYNAQEYISTSRGTDLRVVTVKNKYWFAIQRKSADESEFKSNLHAGGSYELREVDKKTEELCENISKLFNLPLLGIDLLFGEDEDDYTICEVNAFPGLPEKNMLPVLKDIILELVSL